MDEFEVLKLEIRLCKDLDVPLVRYLQKNALIGFDRAGNPLEILYNEIDDERIEIFHAMKARKTFLARLGIKEKA
ncbi:MAG: hypothetical protein FWG07_11235 [Treponema sp.]|nr:hypothetical protein [Treponema sp.]